MLFSPSNNNLYLPNPPLKTQVYYRRRQLFISRRKSLEWYLRVIWWSMVRWLRHWRSDEQSLRAACKTHWILRRCGT